VSEINHNDEDGTPPHVHHLLGVKKIETHLLDIVEYEPDDMDDHAVFVLHFNGTTLFDLAEAYRQLGTFLDDKYAGTEPTA
jgi:hypothetical protein